MSKKAVLAVAACAALGVTVRAATFNDATKDHKLSTEGNWSGGFPAAGVDAKIGPLAEGTYTTDSDLTAKSFSLETGSSTTPITLALGAHTWTASGWQALGANKVTIDGGTWIVNGDANPAHSSNNSFVCLTNGATLTASGRTSIGWSGNDNTLFLSGTGTKWVANSTIQAHLGNSPNNTRNLLYVNDGAYFSTKSSPFNIGQDGYGNTVRVESGATAEFLGLVNLGRANTDMATPTYSGRGENKIIVAGGCVNIPGTLNVGCRPCAPSNRVEVTDNGRLFANTIYLGANNGAGSAGSSYNTLYVADGGVVTASVHISTSRCEGYEPPHGNVFTVGTNGSFVARTNTSLTVIGMQGYDNGLRVMGAKEFDASISSVTIGDKEATNNWLKATDTDRMKFANLYCGGTGNGNWAEFENVTNLVFDLLYCGQYSSNNTVTIMGTKSLTANEIALGRYCGSGNRMTIGVSDSLNVAQSLKIGYGTEVSKRGDPRCADDCHLKIVGCGENRLAFNPFDKIYPGTKGANCSLEVAHIETPALGNVDYPSPGVGSMSNFVYRISGASVVTSAGSVNMNSGFGAHAFVSGAGTKWTHGEVGKNNGFFNVGTIRADSHFTVEDGAEIFCGDSTVAFGNAGHTSLTVGNDATLNVYRLRMNGSNNTLVISNGMLNIRNECGLPSTSLNNIAAVDDRIAFYGTHPRLQTDNVTINLGANRQAAEGVEPAYGTTLFFDVPESGYVAPPVESLEGAITVSTSTKLTASVERFREAGGGNVLLMRANKGIGIGDIETLCSGLPARTRLNLKNDNKELWLHVSGNGGFTLIVR